MDYYMYVYVYLLVDEAFPQAIPNLFALGIVTSTRCGSEQSPWRLWEHWRTDWVDTGSWGRVMDVEEQRTTTTTQRTRRL